jgi:hypothetical protein
MLYEIQPYTACAALLKFNATDGHKYAQGKIPGKHLWSAVKKEVKQLLCVLVAQRSHIIY